MLRELAQIERLRIMADGQAATAPETLDDLAAFFVDNPTDQPRPTPRDENTTKPPEKKPSADTPEPGDTPEEDDKLAPEESEDEDAKADEDDDDESEEDAEKRTSEKFKVTIKGEDGADVEEEVTLDELTKGYMRQADYTRKRQADEQVKGEFAQRGVAALETQRQRHIEQSQKQLALLRQASGVRSREEMAVLAQNDPALWAQEMERATWVNGIASQIEQTIQAEQAESQRQREALMTQQLAHAWGVLGQKGIDKPTLRKIYDGAAKHFGFSDEEFANVSDPRVVLMMRAANAYMEVKAKTKDVTQKAREAPRLPPQRQTVPRNEKLAKAIDARFKGGKAGVDDLAAYFAVHKL
jgi:hypothetical protein